MVELQVVPHWVPRLGGRPVPTRPVVVVASAGAAILLVMWTPLVLWWSFDHSDMTPTGTNVVGLLYLPLVAWAPLLAAVTFSYARQHRATERRAVLECLGSKPAS